MMSLIRICKNNFIAHIIIKLLNAEMCECCESVNIKPTLPKCLLLVEDEEHRYG